MATQKKYYKLGDAVEKLIDTVVPKKIVDKVKEGDCGCSKRKAALNNLIEKK